VAPAEGADRVGRCHRRKSIGPRPGAGSLPFGAMASLTPQQLRTRDRFEAIIGFAAPFLDAVLAAGDRISRIVGPESEYYPIRPAGEAFELPSAGRVADQAEPAS